MLFWQSLILVPLIIKMRGISLKTIFETSNNKWMNYFRNFVITAQLIAALLYLSIRYQIFGIRISHWGILLFLVYIWVKVFYLVRTENLTQQSEM